jgi:hypothetical protein
MLVVPRGVEHRTHADDECELVMFEPETTVNTGDVKGDMTVEKLEWVQGAVNSVTFARICVPSYGGWPHDPVTRRLAH